MSAAAMLGCLAAVPAAAQPAGNVEIRAMAAAFDTARQHGDRAELERMLASDFLYVRADGKIGGRRDYVDGFTGAGQHLDPFRVIDPLFVRASPDAAIVGGEVRLSGTDGGVPFRQHFRYADTWAKRDGRWVVVYEQVTPLPSE